MKVFMGIDLTNDKKNEKVNGEEFLVARPSIASSQSLERSVQSNDDAMKKSNLPGILRGIQWLSGLTAIALAYGVVKAFIEKDNITLSSAYHKAPWIFWLCIGCAVLWALLKFWSVRREKTVTNSDETLRVVNNLKANTEAVYAELSVPSYAREADVLSFLYKVKGDKIKVCDSLKRIVPYFNPVFRVYADANNLYLAHLEEGKFSIPLCSIKAIRAVNKRVRMMGWNKEEKYNSENYRKYKIMVDQMGCITFKGYHIIEFDHNGEEWGIYIPSYELPTFEALTGLKATEGK